MKDYNTKSHKTDGLRTKPVRVVTRDNREIEAVHHVVNSTAQVLNLYINERDGGIDLRIPLSNVAVVVRSAAGARAVKSEASDADTIVSEEVERGDIVTVRDEDTRRRVLQMTGDGAVIGAKNKPVWVEPVSDLNVVEKADNDVLAADGGR